MNRYAKGRLLYRLITAQELGLGSIEGLTHDRDRAL